MFVMLVSWMDECLRSRENGCSFCAFILFLGGGGACGVMFLFWFWFAVFLVGIVTGGWSFSSSFPFSSFWLELYRRSDSSNYMLLLTSF